MGPLTCHFVCSRARRLRRVVRIMCNISGCVIGSGRRQNAESDISICCDGNGMWVIFFDWFPHSISILSRRPLLPPSRGQSLSLRHPFISRTLHTGRQSSISTQYFHPGSRQSWLTVVYTQQLVGLPRLCPLLVSRLFGHCVSSMALTIFPLGTVLLTVMPVTCYLVLPATRLFPCLSDYLPALKPLSLFPSLTYLLPSVKTLIILFLCLSHSVSSIWVHSLYFPITCSVLTL